MSDISIVFLVLAGVFVLPAFVATAALIVFSMGTIFVLLPITYLLEMWYWIWCKVSGKEYKAFFIESI